jgi:hypothetical protein
MHFPVKKEPAGSDNSPADSPFDPNSLEDLVEGVCQACLHVHVLDNCLTFFGQE